MTVEEIVRILISGDDVHLKEGEIYNFTGYHSIPVHSNIYGNNAMIICDDFYKTGEDGVENAQLTFLFNAFEGSSFNDLVITGPGNSIGSSDYSKVWGAINIIENSNIVNCGFENCDKWAIRVESKGPVMRTSYIENCYFLNIKRQGYGYGIWNAYGDARVSNCKFTNCRHGLDISSQRACYVIRDCEFDCSNYIHINMHGYGNDNAISTGDKISIVGCKFYDNMQPLQLKLPYTSTGFLEVTHNDFLVSEDKVGLIANAQPIKGFTNPQFIFKDNTFNGENFLEPPVINGPSIVDVSSTPGEFYITNRNDNYIVLDDMDLSTREKFEINDIVSNVKTIDAYLVSQDSSKRSKRVYKDIVHTYGNPIFKFRCTGENALIKVVRNGIIIDTITQFKGWNSYSYSGEGKYELRIFGSGYVLLDDWLEINSKRIFYSTFETDIKLKIIYGSIVPYKVSLVNGESYSGNGCLKVTLNGQGSITLRNNVDK